MQLLSSLINSLSSETAKRLSRKCILGSQEKSEHPKSYCMFTEQTPKNFYYVCILLYFTLAYLKKQINPNSDACSAGYNHIKQLESSINISCISFICTKFLFVCLICLNTQSFYVYVLCLFFIQHILPQAYKYIRDIHV